MWLPCIAYERSVQRASNVSGHAVQEARQRLAHIKYFAGVLGREVGGEFASQTFQLELNSFA